jgi:hypothetical protein
MPDDSVLKIRVEADTGSVKDLGSSLEDVAKKAVTGGDSFSGLEAKVDRTQHSMLEARHSVMLLGEELGVHVPRAVSVLISEIGPVGAALELAFPVLGALALAAVVEQLADKSSKLAAELRKTSAETVDLTIKERDQTDSLEVSNLKLEDQIAKLEGRPTTNKLAEALLEVKIKSDEVASSLAAAFTKSDAALEKNLDLIAQIKLSVTTWVGAVDAFEGALEGIGKQFSTFSGAVNAATNPILFLWKAVSGGVKEAAKDQTEALDSVVAAEKKVDDARLAKKGGTEEEQAEQIQALKVAYLDLAAVAQTAHDTISAKTPKNIELISSMTDKVVAARAGVADMNEEAKALGLTLENAGLEAAAVPIEKFAKDGKAAIEEQVAELDKFKEKNKAALDAGTIDRGTWLTSEITALREAAGANESYLQKLVVMYRDADLGAKADETSKELAIARTKDLTKETQVLDGAAQKYKTDQEKAGEDIVASLNEISESVIKNSQQTQQMYEATTKSAASLDEKQAHIAEQVKITNIDHLASIGLLSKAEEVAQKIAAYEAARKVDVGEINDQLIEQQSRLTSLATATSVGGTPGLGGTEEQRKDYEKQVALVNQLRAQLAEVNAQYDAKIVQQNNTVTSSWEKLRDELRLNTQAMTAESGALNILSQGFSGSFKTAVEQSIETGKNFGRSMEQVLGHTIASLAGFVAEWLAKKAELWALDAVLGKTAAVTTGAGEILSNAAVAASGAYAATAAIPFVGPELAPAAAATAFSGASSWLAVLGFDKGGIIPETGLVLGHAKEGVLTEEQVGWLRGAADGKGKGGSGSHFHGPLNFNFSPKIEGNFDPQTHGAQMFEVFKSKLRLMGARV